MQYPLSSNVFAGADRDRLFRSMRLNWYNLCPIDGETGLPIANQQTPYALYHCQPISPASIQEMQQASERVGRVLMKLWSVIRTLDAETLLDYGFPPETIQVIQYDPLPPWCMRLDWCWNEQTGQKKVVEANPQTPSFWFECTEGNRRVAEHFGLQDPVPGAQNLLRGSLNDHLQRAATYLNKSLSDCRVAFTALNNPEDMGTMQWLSQHYPGKSLVFPLEYLRVQDGDRLFYERNGSPIDILFMWYPLEWAIHDQDDAGNPLWPALEQLILEKKVVVVNFASAFLLQPKSVFSFINDLGYDFFDDEDAATIIDYFPKTSLTPESIGNSYFAKPILGRQGEGGFAVNSGAIATRSSNNDPWYTEQPYVYQELLDFPQVEIAGESMTAVWGAWLYNDGCDRLVAGGVGMRVSEGAITDDYSYWCPIGCK